MKPKTFIPLLLGLVVGVFAIKMVWDVVSNAQAASRSDMASCAVAKVDIQFAEEITAEKIKLVDWPKKSLPENHFGSIEALQGRVSDMFIPKDVPLYATMLAPEGTPPGIQVRIKPGYRAVAVPIDEVSGVSYQVEPGDRVDVVALVKAPKSGGGSEQTSRIILQNIEVATVGRQLHTDKKGETVKSVARSVTLLLTPEEVTRLHLAQSVGGRLSLALRGKDQDPDAAAEDKSEDLAGAAQDSAEPEEVRPVKVHAAPPWNVTVISGEKIENVDYRWQDGRWLSAPGAAEPGKSLQLPAPALPPPPKGAQKNHEAQDDFDSAPAGEWAEES